MLKRLLPFLLLFGLARLVFWFSTFPNPDEAYYWLWGQHPALSYYDHPPFQAWVQEIITRWFGQSFFSLRLANWVSNGILLCTYYRITRYLYGKEGKHYFWMTIALLLASPLYFLFLALAWHDHWLITFSLMAAFQFVQFLDTYEADGNGETRRLYVAAIALGLALLCKYNAVFVGVGCLVAIAVQPKWRELFRDRRLYTALLITGLFLLPIVIWNVNNDFQSFRYYSDRSVDNVAFRFKWLETLAFIGISIVMVSPVNSWAIWRVLRQPRISTYQAIAFWIFAASTLSLLILSLFSTALYYWNILAYLLLFPLLPAALDVGSFENFRYLERAKLFMAGQVYGLLFAGLLVIHYSVLPLSALSDPASDPDSRMLFGWDQVAIAVQQQKADLSQPFFVTTDYRSASALAYQLNDPTVLAISDRMDQFDFWINTSQLKGRDAVIVTDDWHPLDEKLRDRFVQVSQPETVSIKRFGFFIKNYYVARGYSFRSGSPAIGIKA
jgi:4-amino-4-deoxy-L-arabinose transferase-like glycosyltransferase